MIEAAPVDIVPTVSAPRFVKTRTPFPLGGVVPLRGHAGTPGALLQRAEAAEAAAPHAAESFSEILSLSMGGFFYERALTIDRSEYCVTGAAPALEELEAMESLGPLEETAAAAAAEAEPDPVPAPEVFVNPGQALVPKAQAGNTEALAAVEATPHDTGGAVASEPASRPRAELNIAGQLPAIIDEEARLEGLAGRHEPGLVRLRSPRVRSPQSARLVKPAAGSSGMPIRVRPGIRPPSTAGLGLQKLAMERGGEVALRFDRPVIGSRQRMDWCDAPLAPKSSRWAMTQPKLAAGLDLARAGKVEIPLSSRQASPPLIADDAGCVALAFNPVPVLPRPPYVESTIFDPPSFGLIGLELRMRKTEPAGVEQRAQAPTRPVVSYKWRPVVPELSARAADEGRRQRTTMAQLSLDQTAAVTKPGLAEREPGPVSAEVVPGLEHFRLDFRPLLAVEAPGMATRVFPLSINENPRSAGPGVPVALLDQVPAKIPHQLRKSPLKTQADWQRSKWASASVYGSAIWRIAIGKFSGALGQAPGPVRWLAAVTALALGAFALLPARQPSAPSDTSWTIAQKPAAAAAAEGPPPAPAPRRVIRPVEAPVAVVAPEPAPVAPPPARRAGRVRGGARAQQAAAQRAESDGPSLTGVWDGFQRRLAERSAVAVTDDFRNGLADWEGSGDWARSWSYDASGFVRTGALALLAPARELTDYRMEFLGQIERRSMGWVVRAADLRNYVALKLMIVSDGPIPEVALIRYPVINGIAGAARQQILPLDLRSDSVYRVQTEVRGDYIAVTVQGKVVDSWTETRLRKGGVGLFSGKGELARVRWVGVWHQYDTLGRLCALLAPSGLPGRERGAN